MVKCITRCGVWRQFSIHFSVLSCGCNFNLGGICGLNFLIVCYYSTICVLVQLHRFNSHSLWAGRWTASMCCEIFWKCKNFHISHPPCLLMPRWNVGRKYGECKVFNRWVFSLLTHWIRYAVRMWLSCRVFFLQIHFSSSIYLIWNSTEDYLLLPCIAWLLLSIKSTTSIEWRCEYQKPSERYEKTGNNRCVTSGRNLNDE